MQILGVMALVFALIVFILYLKEKKRNDDFQLLEKRQFEEEKEEAQRLEDKLSSLKKEIKEKSEFNNSLKEIREDELNRLMEEKKKEKLLLLDETLKTEQVKRESELAEKYQSLLSNLEEKKDNLEKEIKRISEILLEEQTKQKIINEQISKGRAESEQKEFYRIHLTDSEKEDMAILLEVANRISNKEAVNKLVYEVFVRRPSQEMIKRVTLGEKISGIYKITNITTGEAYIGRSVDIGNRWKEHILSSLSIGTIAHTAFHNILKNIGIENFTWEILEKADKTKLNEKEKYWIDYYETNKVGYNEKRGG